MERLGWYFHWTFLGRPVRCFFCFSKFDFVLEIRFENLRNSVENGPFSIFLSATISHEPMKRLRCNFYSSILGTFSSWNFVGVSKFDSDPELWSEFGFLSTAEVVVSRVKPVIMVRILRNSDMLCIYECWTMLHSQKLNRIESKSVRSPGPAIRARSAIFIITH